MDSSICYFIIVISFLFWLYNKLAGGKDTLEALGIPHPKTLPILGNALPILLRQVGFAEFTERMYKQFADNKVFGFYNLFGEYTIMIKDPALVKKIFVKDFEHFVNRDPIEQNDTDRLLSKSVLMMRDQKWKDMRATISPIYTSSKLKMMFGMLAETVNDFIDFYEAKAARNQGKIDIETHDVFARITADGIATTGLGFKGDCVRNEDSEIFKIAEAMEADFTNPTTGILVNTIPGLFKLIGKQVFRKSVHAFFETNVLGEIQRRKQHNIHRSDVIQMLIEANDGKLKLETGDEVDANYVNTKVKKISKWTDEELAAQALILFLGGFETTASMMQVISWELAKNPSVQQKLIDEVDDVLATLNGQSIPYEKLNQMKYLDMVLNEALRKWPAFRVTPRYCEKDYVLKSDDGESYKIKSGTDVMVPIGAIQRDPKYYPCPDKFDPERFSEENRGKIPSGAFLPFGLGPRVCPGSRYALLEAKLLLFSIIAKFEILECEKTPENLTFGSGTFGYNETIYVALSLRN